MQVKADVAALLRAQTKYPEKWEPIHLFSLRERFLGKFPFKLTPNQNPQQTVREQRREWDAFDAPIPYKKWYNI